MTDMTAEFIAKFGEDALQDLCESAYAQEDTAVVHFLEHYMIDRLNYVHQGIFERGCVEYVFELIQGNMDGMSIKFGENLSLDKPKPPALLIFVPRHPNCPTAKQVFPVWQKQDWFLEKQKSMNYDMMFDPVNRTRTHYRDWAAKRGLTIVREASNE